MGVSDTDSLIKEYSIEFLMEYRVSLIEYLKLAPNEIVSLFKIEDIFKQYSMARYFLTQEEDSFKYSQGSAENTRYEKLFYKSSSLLSSLQNYNHCIDLTWQLIHLYANVNDYQIIQDETVYEKELKKVNFRLLKRLKNTEYEHLYKKAKQFIDLKTVMDIREIYQYSKHRGSFHIDGFGLPQEDFPIFMSGIQLKSLKRRVLNPDELTKNLIEFDIKFYNYLLYIISNIFPKGVQIDNTIHIEEISERMQVISETM